MERPSRFVTKFRKGRDCDRDAARCWRTPSWLRGRKGGGKTSWGLCAQLTRREGRLIARRRGGWWIKVRTRVDLVIECVPGSPGAFESPFAFIALWSWNGKRGNSISRIAISSHNYTDLSSVSFNLLLRVECSLNSWEISRWSGMIKVTVVLFSARAGDITHCFSSELLKWMIFCRRLSLLHILEVFKENCSSWCFYNRGQRNRSYDNLNFVIKYWEKDDFFEFLSSKIFQLTYEASST